MNKEEKGKEEQTKQSAISHNFSLSDFKKANETMIATNEDSYKTYYLFWDKQNKDRDYSEEEVESIIRNGSASSMSILSRNYFNQNGFYKQIITHYATLLKYTGLLVPTLAYGKSLQDTAIAKRYSNATDFVDRIKIEEFAVRVAYRVLLDGMYFGAVQTMTKTAFSVLDLPFQYCRSRFKDEYDRDIVEFDVSYFDMISDKKNRKQALKTYPKVISSYYHKWLNGGKRTSSWVFLPTDIGIAFKLFNARPYFLSVIPTIMQYDKAVDIGLEKELEEIKRLIIQKIPHLNDGTLLFEPEEVSVMHSGVVNMISSKNPHASVMTTYGDVDVHSLKTTDGVTNNTLTNMRTTMYANAGVSPELFAASGSSSLGTSLQEDVSLMMVLGNKIANFITAIVNSFYGNGTIQFKFHILPITYHNEQDMMNNYLKLANSGYSFLLPALACGISQKELGTLKDLENDVLNLRERLLPLATSYTQSGSEDNSGGRPQKDDLDKTEKTIENIESKDKTGG